MGDLKRRAGEDNGYGPIEVREFLVGLGWAYSPELAPDRIEGNADGAGAEVVLYKDGEEYGRYLFDGEDSRDPYAALRSLPTFLRPEDLEGAGWDAWEGGL